MGRTARTANVCRDVQRFFDEELPPLKHAAFKAHLEICRDCQDDLAWMARMDAEAAQVLLSGGESQAWTLAVRFFLIGLSATLTLAFLMMLMRKS